MRVSLAFPDGTYELLMEHLLPKSGDGERLAFVFAREEKDGDHVRLQYVDHLPIDDPGFEHQSKVYLEITDEMRGAIIKKAHDLGTSLVEFHSHPFPGPAAFSSIDLDGLAEFVPHVRWRLKGRTYLAIVVGPTSFDALAWANRSTTPGPLEYLRAGERVLQPTGRTLTEMAEPNG